MEGMVEGKERGKLVVVEVVVMVLNLVLVGMEIRVMGLMGEAGMGWGRVEVGLVVEMG